MFNLEPNAQFIAPAMTRCWRPRPSSGQGLTANALSWKTQRICAAPLEQREDKSAALRSGHGVDPKGPRVAVTAD